MHREILGLTINDGIQTDHVNRNKIDNRRKNLRAVTHKQNGQNVPSQKGASKFRGVTWDKFNKKWVAQAMLNRKSYKIGRFKTEIDAAIAAQQWRLKNMPYTIEEIIRKEVVRVESSNDCTLSI